MIENVLTKKGFSFKAKITIKSVIAAGLVALAVILPQLFHLFAGASAGVKWLPMYIPVLLGGCLLGWKFGLIVGIASPVMSFAITSAFGSPMPALQRLPFMIVELSVFAVVSGLFSDKIYENVWLAFPAVILAEICGRGIFMLAVTIFQSVTPFTPAMIRGQIQTGLIGLFLQAAIIPFVVIGLKKLIDKDNDND